MIAWIGFGMVLTAFIVAICYEPPNDTARVTWGFIFYGGQVLLVIAVLRLAWSLV